MISVIDENISEIIPMLLNRSEFTQNCEIQVREDGERGLFAVRDIRAGELIFRDFCVLYGPKNSVQPVCSCCYRMCDDLKACQNRCSLPVCPKCAHQVTSDHDSDCKAIRKWQTFESSNWSLNSLRALTPIRALSMKESDKKILKELKSHEKFKKSMNEIDLFLRLLDDPLVITKDDETCMHNACSVLQTNSFEVPIVNYEKNEKHISYIRGIYPLAAMLNHSCAPNVRHCFVSNNIAMNNDNNKKPDEVYLEDSFRPPIIELRARRDITNGEELTITYCDITDITHVRRAKMFTSKDFWCECERCKDKTEFGTNISAFKCIEEHCPGLLLPEDPLNQLTKYVCSLCKIVINEDIVRDYQKAALNLLQVVERGGLKKVINFFRNDEKSDWLPTCNFVYIKLKIYLISNLGHQEGYYWNELSFEELSLKKQACDDILSFLKNINFENSSLHGSLLYETQICIRLLSDANNDLKVAEKYRLQAQKLLNRDVMDLLNISILPIFN